MVSARQGGMSDALMAVSELGLAVDTSNTLPYQVKKGKRCLGPEFTCWRRNQVPYLLVPRTEEREGRSLWCQTAMSLGLMLGYLCICA